MHNIKPQVPILALFMLVLLSACGGDGSSSDPPDTEPNAFSFSGRSDAAPDTLIESDPIAIAGINAPAPVSINGGEYSIDGETYTNSEGTITNGQEVRVRVLSSSEPHGSVAASLTIGDVSATFTVVTADFSSRVEAEEATLVGGASSVTDNAASNGGAVLVGTPEFGLTVSDSIEAEAVIVAYRSTAAQVLSLTVNGASAGELALPSSEGVYTTASAIVSVSAGDTVTLVNSTTETEATETYLDYLEFTDTPFREVSTVVNTGHTTSDGASIGPDGNIYVSGGPDHQNILRITPAGEISVFASGFVSANGSDFDSAGNLYVADYRSSAVRRITPDGTMTTFASSLDGPAGIWVDADDNVLVSLFGGSFSGAGSTVLSISPDGTVSTYASGGGLLDVIGIVGDENGRVYASNWAGGQLYDITDGSVTLLAETGGSANQICYSNGYIYLPSPGSALIRRVSLNGIVEIFAGTSERQSVNGPIAEADFARPNSCDFAAGGTILYVMDRDTGELRKIDSGRP